MGPKDRVASRGDETKLRLAEAFPPESVASFRTEVQRGGRIVIPKVERKQLGIGEGDAVSVLLVKAKGPKPGARPKR